MPRMRAPHEHEHETHLGAGSLGGHMGHARRDYRRGRQAACAPVTHTRLATAATERPSCHQQRLPLSLRCGTAPQEDQPPHGGRQGTKHPRGDSDVT